MSFKFGRVALIGKPNVGKSTILNHLVGQKVSIVSDKPQTTRNRILGVAHRPNAQIGFYDTPGIHIPITRLDKSMLQASKSTYDQVDLVVAVADGSHHPGKLDQEVAQALHQNQLKVPIILCLNKMDRLKAENVEPFIEKYCELFGTETYMLTQANRGINLDKLEQLIIESLPDGQPEFTEDELTDQSTRFLCSELVREQILKHTRQELPYATAVMVDIWDESQGLLKIEMTVLVEKPSQRSIIIGKSGQILKAIGQAARIEIEGLLARKVYLGLHIRVEPGWRMKPQILHEFLNLD